MEMQKNERGITLVALVVTIVVLLILAGVTIMYVMSDNGIFGQAQKAGDDTNSAAVQEATFTAVMGLYPVVYSSTAADDTALAAELKTAFESNMPSSMKPTGGNVTASKGSVDSLSVDGYTLTYKGVTYNISYDKENGAKAEPVTGGTTEP